MKYFAITAMGICMVGVFGALIRFIIRGIRNKFREDEYKLPNNLKFWRLEDGEEWNEKKVHEAISMAVIWTLGIVGWSLYWHPIFDKFFGR